MFCCPGVPVRELKSRDRGFENRLVGDASGRAPLDETGSSKPRSRNPRPVKKTPGVVPAASLADTSTTIKKKPRQVRTCPVAEWFLPLPRYLMTYLLFLLT